MFINSEVVLHILRRSAQGLTPFEILDYLLTQPQYQGCSRASLFSKLLPELQNLRDSQVVAHVSPRWMLVEALDKTSEELSDEHKDAVSFEQTSETQASVTPDGSDEDPYPHLQEWTAQVGDKVLVKGRGSSLFSVLRLTCIGSEIYAELSHPSWPELITITRHSSELILADSKALNQKFTEPNNAKSILVTKEDGNIIKASLHYANSEGTDAIQEETHSSNNTVTDLPIEILNLSKRVYHQLKRTGINTVRELQYSSDERLCSIKNFGLTSLANVRSALTNLQPLPQSTQIQIATTTITPSSTLGLSNVCESSLNVSIERLNLSIRAFNCLKKAGINTIRVLSTCSDEDLLGIDGFGQNSLADVRLALAKFQPPLQITPTTQTQKVSISPEWTSIPILQIPTNQLSVSIHLRVLVSRYPVIANLIDAFEAGDIPLNPLQHAELKVALTPFHALREAPQSYLDWLASLSKVGLLTVLTKHEWTPSRLGELSPRQILLAIPSDDRKTTHKAILAGEIPSKHFTTITEEIDDWLNSLEEKQQFVLTQSLGWQSGEPKSFADIGREMGISRERVRQIEGRVKNKLIAPISVSIFPKLRQVAIEALRSAGCISTLEDWCEAISQTYPPGKIHLPLVISWFIEFIPEIHIISTSGTKLHYIAPLTREFFSNIQEQMIDFWKGQRISAHSQLHQILLPLLPEDILHPAKVTSTLINAICYEALPGIFSSEAWSIVDYAYYVLYEVGKALHFKEIGQRIKQLKPDWKAENIERAAQGAIDRHPDIIRCGSGIYGLREWGTMEYSHFREVLLDYLSRKLLPIDAEEIYADLSQFYAVSRPTVIMNLNLHPNLFKKFGYSNFYGVVGRLYDLPDQELVNLLVAKLESGPIGLPELEEDIDFCKYSRDTLYLYLNVSPLFRQLGSFKDKKFALFVDGKRHYQAGDASKIVEDIFNQVREPLHARDLVHLARNYYAYPPGESAFWRIFAEHEYYITITEAIFISRDWMSHETLGCLLEDLNTELLRKIVLFTLSSKRSHMHTDVLFSWLSFCYQNRFYYRGSLIFAQINLDELSDKKSKVARQIGRVCQQRGDISVLDLGQDANSEEIDRTLRLNLEDLRQQAQSGQRTPSKGLASKPDGKYRVRHVEVGVEVHVSKKGGTDNPYAHILQVLINGKPFDPSKHNPIPANTATLEQRHQALQKLYATKLTAYGQVDSYLQVAIGPRPSWGIGYRQMEPLTENTTGMSHESSYYSL